MNDSELIEQARNGDKEAFGELIKRYQSLAKRIALGMIKNVVIADELVQESLLQAYLSLENLQNTQKFRSWLYGIVLNVCRGYLRDQKILALSLENLPNSMVVSLLSQDDPQIYSEEQEQHRLILEAINFLSVKNQKAILLFYYQGLSLQEIALALAISVTSVKGRLHKGRKQLRERLSEYYFEDIKENSVMIQVKVVDVVNFKESSDVYSHFAVLLLDETGQRVLPIWVGKYEGESIALGLREFATVRPMTFNFMAKLLEASGTSLEEVRVESLKDNTFYGIAKLRIGDKTQEVDARPSDVIALAVRTGAPIFVAPDVMEKAAKPIPKNANALGNGLSSIVKDVEGQVATARAIINKSQEDQEKTQAELLKFVFGS